MADLAQCARCRGFTLLDKTGPVAVAVDLTALDVEQYRASLVAGGSRYWVFVKPGAAPKVRPAPLGGPPPAWGENGAQRPAQGFGLTHAEHGCPTSVQKVVKSIDPKGSRPVTPGALAAGSHPLAAHVYAERGPATRSPAATATHRLSNAYPVCGTCGRNIKAGQIFTGVQHGNSWQWAEHERCE